MINPTILGLACFILLGACGGPPLQEAQSFKVFAWQTPKPSQEPGSPSPAAQRVDFTVRLDPIARTLTAGNDGGTHQVSVNTNDNVTFRTTEPLRVQGKTMSCQTTALYHQFWVTMTETGFDGGGRAS